MRQIACKVDNINSDRGAKYNEPGDLHAQYSDNSIRITIAYNDSGLFRKTMITTTELQ